MPSGIEPSACAGALDLESGVGGCAASRHAPRTRRQGEDDAQRMSAMHVAVENGRIIRQHGSAQDPGRDSLRRDCHSSPRRLW